MVTIRRVFIKITCFTFLFILIYLGSCIDFSIPKTANSPRGTLGLATVPGSSDPSEDEWPMFRGQLNHTGEAHTIPMNGASPFWSYTTGNEVHSSPAVVDQSVYVGSNDHKVYCLNATTGGLIWNYTTGAAVTSSPAVSNGRVYVGSQDDQIYCLNATTGKYLWSYATNNSVFSSPAVAIGRVYVGSWDKKVYCLNATTGGFLWSYTTGDGVSSSPAVVGGRVYVGSNDNKVYCLDAITGGFLWNYTTGAGVGNSPAVAGGRVYVDDAYRVYCLNATTGGFLWSYNTGQPVYSSPAVADGRVFTGTVRVNCLNATTGKQLWNNSLVGSVDSSPAVAGGCVYLGSGNKKVYCLNATTGKLLWYYLTGGYLDSSPAVAGGRVFVGSYDHKVYCLPGISTPTYTSVNESADPLELGSTETITIAGVAALSGIQTVLIAYEGQNHTMAYLGGNVWRYNAWIPSYVGNYTYKIYIRDSVGNWNVTIGAIQVVHTKLNVVLLITSPSNGTIINSPKIWINGTVSAGPGQIITKMLTNNTSFINATSLEGNSSGVFGYYNISNIAKGILSINITAVNGLGNMSSGLVTFTVLDAWTYSTTSNVTSVAISDDGQYITALDRNGKTYLFQRNNSTPLWVNSSFTYPQSVAISGDGQYIATAVGASFGVGKVQLFQRNSSTPLWSYSTSAPPTSIGISGDGQYIAAGSWVGYSNYETARLFSRSRSTPLWSVQVGNVRSVAISDSSPSGDPYIVFGGDFRISLFQRFGKIWDYTTGDYVESVAISNDGIYIAVGGGGDKKVYLFQCGSLTPLWVSTTGDSVRSVAISSDGQYIIAGSNDNNVYLFRRNSSTPLWSYSTGGDVRNVAISSDGKYITAGCSNNKIFLFQRESSTPLWSFSTSGYVQTLAISSNGQYITAGSNNTIYFFDVGALESRVPFYQFIIESADPLELGATETITITGVMAPSGINTVLIEFEGTNHTMANLGEGTWRYNMWSPSTIGNYSYALYIQNNHGLWNTTSGSIQVIPSTLPTYNLVTESADPLELGGMETITIFDVTDFSGIQTVLLAFEGNNHTMTSLGGGTWRYNTWAPNATGDYPYRIYIQDNLSNWNMTSGAIQVVNATIPTYTLVTESADPLELGQMETITIFGVADLSGIQTVLLEIEGSNHSMTNLGSGTWRYNTWAPSTVNDYPYTIYIQDNIGNWNATGGLIQVVDTTPPTYLFNNETADPLELGGTETITITGVADLSGIQTVLLACEGNNHTMTNLGSGIWCYNTWAPNNTGNYPYSIYIQDNLGYWNMTSNMIQVVDTIPPTYIFIIESDNPLEFGSNETITIVGVADLSGIQAVLLEIEGNNHTMTNLGSGTWRYNTWAPNSTGDKSYTIYVQDNIGNWNATSGIIQVVDTTLPTYASIIESADSLELGSTETITIFGVADLSGIQTVLLEIEGSNHSMTNLGSGIWRYNTWAPNSTGDKSYTIYVQDNTGNWNSTSSIIQVVDTTSPTFTSVTESADPLELGSTETITIIGVADLSEIQTVLLEIEGSNHSMTNLGSGTWRYNTWVPGSTGDYLYTLFIRDNIGNWNTTSGMIQVVDTTPPTYISITESPDPLELGSTEAITIVGVADLSGIQAVILSCEGSNHTMINLVSGTWCYITWAPNSTGNYLYTIYIQDNMGNWNVTSGFIQVIDSIPPILDFLTVLEPLVWLFALILIGNVIMTLIIYRRQNKKIQQLLNLISTLKKDLQKKTKS